MGYFPGGGFHFGFSIMGLLFITTFGAGIVVLAVVAVRGIRQWSYNNAQPQVPVRARVVAKRQDVSQYYSPNTQPGVHPTGHMNYSTTYYATLEFENGQRLELTLPGNRYGLVTEGDEGVLTFQGTRFIGFERK